MSGEVYTPPGPWRIIGEADSTEQVFLGPTDICMGAVATDAVLESIVAAPDEDGDVGVAVDLPALGALYSEDATVGAALEDSPKREKPKPLRPLTPQEQQRVADNLGLVWIAVKNMSGKAGLTTFSEDDLFQIGTFGLMKAVQRFDESRGTQLSTYAMPTIVGEIKRGMRDKGHTIRVPRAIYANYPKVRDAFARLQQDHGTEPTVAEVASATGLDEKLVEDVVEYIQNGLRHASLDKTTDPENNFSLHDTASVLDEEDPVVEAVMLNTLWDLIEDAHKRNIINGRHKAVIYYLYFSGPSMPTQEEVAKRVGYSQMHVSRLRSQALSALEAHFNAAQDEPYQPLDQSSPNDHPTLPINLQKQNQSRALSEAHQLLAHVLDMPLGVISDKKSHNTRLAAQFLAWAEFCVSSSTDSLTEVQQRRFSMMRMVLGVGYPQPLTYHRV